MCIRDSSRSRKKFGGPQPQRNHRAQLRSHARHVHEDETEIDFPVGVPKGLTPATSNASHLYNTLTTYTVCKTHGNPSHTIQTSGKKNLLETHDTLETFVAPLNLPQNWTQGGSRHAAVESEVKSCELLHPEAKIKEHHPKIVMF